MTQGLARGPRSHRHRNRSAGFTLVEIIVVLAIAGLMLAVTPPLITAAMPGVELKAAARRTAGTLRQAREASIARGTPVAWELDTKGHRYAILALKRKGSLPDDVHLELIGAREEMQGDGVGRIRFHPDGTSTGGRVILSRDGRGYQVGVNWLTGRILIADWKEAG